jgi:hypothetical protein
MLTTLFILSLLAVALWRPLVRALIAALIALLVFAGIHVARAIDAMTTVSPVSPVSPVSNQVSVQGDAVDHGSG